MKYVSSCYNIIGSEDTCVTGGESSDSAASEVRKTCKGIYKEVKFFNL